MNDWTLVDAIREHGVVCPPGSVVILRGMDEEEAAGFFDELRIKGQGQENILFIALPDDRPVELLDEQGMAGAGWY
jgi:hypothetical protein